MMARVLYFHHFYSAFIFNTMITAGVVDMIGSIYGRRTRDVVSVVLLALVVTSFYVYSPLSYGIPVNEDRQTYGYIKSLKWYDSWQY